MHDFNTLLLGLVFAFLGGELFVRGVVGISDWFRIPKAITAATLAAFATSGPEVAVGVSSALDGRSTIALGDALGSNIVNIGLILGLSLLFGALPIRWRSIRREFVSALLAPSFILYALGDGHFSRLDAVFSLLIFGVWFSLVFFEAKKARSELEKSITLREGRIAVLCAVGGLVFLILAGESIVEGATGIGRALGMSEFLIGATIVAFGTSCPELATVLVSRLRGHDDIGVGTLLGSNIFNCLFIVGIAGLIAPFDQSPARTFPSVLFGLLCVATMYPFGAEVLKKNRGVVLLGLYATSILVTILVAR